MWHRVGVWWIMVLMPVLAGHGSDLVEEKSLQLLKKAVLEYRTQFSNVGTSSGKIIAVEAGKRWQRTGVLLHKGDSVIISYLRGRWSINPAQKACDGNGCPGMIADNDSYVMALVNEGALCGKIGEDGEPFFIGNTREIVAEGGGELYLVVNDDIDHERGAGFADNSGELEIVIYIAQY